MDQVVFGTLTVKHLVMIGAGLVGLVVLIALIRKIFGSKESSTHSQPVRCTSCGWTGQVSRFAGHCPKCNKPLGQQKATPKK